MKSHFQTTDIWKSLTSSATKSRKPAFVAVAYFGKGASKLLPLRSNSCLVVDASDNSVKNGQTHPADLKKLQKLGVVIYSVANLHAKVYAFDEVAFVGSANASKNSAKTLVEAVMRVTDRASVRSVKIFVQRLCVNELTPGTLDRLQKIYRPPSRSDAKQPRNSSKRGRAALPRTFLVQLVRGEPPVGSESAEEKGHQIAKALRKHGRTYNLQDFYWSGNAPFQKGDKIIQVVQEVGGRRLIDAPGTVLHTQPWRRKGRRTTFVYLELPNWRRVSLTTLARRIGYGAKKKLLKNGLIRDHDFAENLLGNWSAKT